VKKIILISILITTTLSSLFSQDIRDLGTKSFYDIKSREKTGACEITPGKALTYCVEDGSRITYIFENSILYGIMFQTPFLTKSQAEKELNREVSSFAYRNNIEPVYGNGMALFFQPDNPIAVSYGLKDYMGTTYLMYYTFLSK
jgi:hypothetical protein